MKRNSSAGLPHLPRACARLLLPGLAAGFVLALSLILTSTARAQPGPTDVAPDRLSGTTRLIDLGFTDLRATGTRPSLDVFFAGPGDFRLGERSQLTLFFTHSNLLIPDRSTVTVIVNGRPLRSIPLNANNIERSRYEVAVPKDLIRKDFNRLTLQYAMTLGGDCEDPTHPALWATLLQESFLQLDFADSPPKAEIEASALSTYPYPFFRGGYPVIAPVAIVIPSDPANEEVAAAYRLAADITQRVTFDTALIDVRRADTLTTGDLATHQLIVLGTPDRQPLVQPLLTGTVKAQGGALARDARPLAQDNGYLLLAASPWNPGLRALLISGASMPGMLRGVDALTSPEPSGLLSGPEAFLVEPVAVAASQRQFATAFTFQQLNVPDHTAAGAGSTDIFDVTFNAPALAPSANATLDLLVSTPDSLDRRRSNAVVELNNSLVNTIPLKNTEQSRASYKIALPSALVQVGLNVLRVKTTLYSTDPTGFGPCYSAAPERLWAIYHNTSAISLSTVESAAATTQRATLAALPVPFSGAFGLQDTTFVVDPGRSVSLRGGMLAAMSLGRRGSTRDLQVQVAARATPQSIGDRHVVAVGLDPETPLGQEMAKVLPLLFRPGGSRALVDKNETLTEILDSARVAAIQEAPVPWAQASRKLLAISATDDSALMWATEGLLKRGLTGNVALFRSPTQVNTFTLERRTDQDVQQELDKRFATSGARLRNLLIFAPVFGGALLLLGAWVAVPRLRERWRRRRASR
ncbi:MAG: cellulose biosynthesis cyclic di-GMP-binding regulatory protein BcsB [Dehalococcoidia bacterium]